VRGLARLVARWAADAAVLAGIVLVAVGASGYHPALGPIVAGAGLILVVRYGSRPPERDA
jgi:hypothetical protein